MFKSVRPYMGRYVTFTARAAVSITVAVILSAAPYLFSYQIISPLVAGKTLDFGFVMTRVALSAICLVGHAALYVHGLSLSHIAAFNTLKNLRTALQ